MRHATSVKVAATEYMPPSSRLTERKASKRGENRAHLTIRRYHYGMLARDGWILAFCGAAGRLVGFAALAAAAAYEPSLPATVVALFSPGLRVAEVLVPGRHESLGWTFGWFLRVAIGANALFYFVLFACGRYLAKRLLARSERR